MTGVVSAPEAPKVHAIIYSWPKVHENALAIASALVGHAARVSVVACADEPLEHDPGVEVFLLDKSCYFGRQFEKTIEVFDGDVLLQIAADTTTASWGALASPVRAALPGQSRPSASGRPTSTAPPGRTSG